MPVVGPARSQWVRKLRRPSCHEFRTKVTIPLEESRVGVMCLPLPSQAGKKFNLNKTRRALAPEGYKYEHWTLWVDSGPAGPSRLNLFGASGISDGAADHGGSASEVPAGV